MPKRTELEDELARQLDLAKIPYEREYKAIEWRRFRWDFAIFKDSWMIGLPTSTILVEVQGGIWVGGGHSTGTGITRDCEKLNLATLAGFRTIQLTKEQIKSGQALLWIQEAVEK